MELTGKQRGHSTLQFGKDTVTKTSEPNLMRVEVEKTRRAYEIGRNCGLFRVPEVLEYDEAGGTAVFERLDVRPVSKAVNWGEPRKDFANVLGTSLAIIHRELILPENMRIPLQAELALPYQEVFLHGDLSVGNVCVGTPWPPIVILDWQMTPLYGGKATFGTRYFDIFWFINNLINRPFFRFLFSNPVGPAVEAFLEAYFEEAKCPYEKDKVVPYARRFFEVEVPRVRQEIIQKSIGRSRILLTCSRRILKEFMQFLDTMKPGSEFPGSSISETGCFEMKDYRKSHLHPEKGKLYHSAFEENPYRRMVWEFERKILDTILSRCFEGVPIHHLDFACGTGRILSYMEDRAKSSTGVDLSPSMLEIALKNNKHAEILEADLTQDDVLGEKKFNLITAFRFFPNAEGELRTEAMEVLTRHLDDGGLLVFNNHRNTGSTRFRLARLLGRGRARGMSMGEVKELLAKHNLELLWRFPLSIFPASEERKLLPISILTPLESFLSRLPIMGNFGENIVFVCRKMRKKRLNER